MNRRRAADRFSGHIAGLVNDDRWKLIDRAWNDIGEDGEGRISQQVWQAMSERDRALFPGKEPTL